MKFSCRYAATHPMGQTQFPERRIFGDAMDWSTDQMDDLADKSLLDAGCGTGTASLYFAAHGANVTGFDAKTPALEQAEKLTQDLGLSDRLQFQSGDLNAMPFADNSFDIVFSRSVLQYNDKAPLLAQYARILKPNGKLIIIENLPKNPVILIYRAVRRLTGWSQRKRKYMNSIVDYITPAQIDAFSQNFKTTQQATFHLMDPVGISLASLLKTPRPYLALRSFDSYILNKFPALNKYCWLVAVCFEKKKDV